MRVGVVGQGEMNQHSILTYLYGYWFDLQQKQIWRNLQLTDRP